MRNKKNLMTLLKVTRRKIRLRLQYFVFSPLLMVKTENFNFLSKLVLRKGANIRVSDIQLVLFRIY